MGRSGELWSAAEREAWRPRPRLGVADWAEANRTLTREQSDREGQWRNSAAPYGAGIMDLFGDDAVEEITIEKAGQLGVSEFARNYLAWLAENEPDPALLVLPNEHSGVEIFSKRILSLFGDVASFGALRSGAARDTKVRSLRLANGFTVRLGWARSPASLKSHPVRTVILDEIDEYADFSGRNADPRSLAIKRTRTYGARRKIIEISTPTTDDGLIHQLRESAPIQLRYFTPCPHCQRYQELEFEQLRWETREGLSDEQLAATLEAADAVWLECSACGARISERDKPALVRAGVWATPQVGPTLTPQRCAGLRICREGWPAGRWAGLRISAMVCLWERWTAIAAEFLRAKNRPDRMQDFVNQTLARPYRQRVFATTTNVFAQKCHPEFREKTLPDWALAVITTADVQLDHVWFVTRAWGPGLRSRRIHHGRLEAIENDPAAFDELLRIAFEIMWPYAEAARGGLQGIGLGIDRRYRTEEVDALSRRDPRVRSLMGHDKPLSAWTMERATLHRPKGKRATKRYRAFWSLFDANRAQEWLEGAIRSRLAPVVDERGELREEELWELNARDDDEYNRQLCGEHKVRVRKSGKWLDVWEARGPNHLRDCEKMQRPLAWLCNLETLTETRGAPRPRSWGERRRRVG